MQSNFSLKPSHHLIHQLSKAPEKQTPPTPTISVVENLGKALVSFLYHIKFIITINCLILGEMHHL